MNFNNQLRIFKFMEIEQKYQIIKLLENGSFEIAISRLKQILKNGDFQSQAKFEGLGNNQFYKDYTHGYELRAFLKRILAGQNIFNQYDVLALIFSTEKRYSQALDWYFEMLIKFPNKYELLIGLGHVYYNDYNPYGAQKMYQQAKQLNVNNVLNYQCLATLYTYRFGHFLKGWRYAYDCLQLNPKCEMALVIRAQAILNYAFVDYHLKKCGQCENYIQRVILKYPNIIHFYHLKLSLKIQRSIEQVLDICKKIYELEPECIWSYYHLAARIVGNKNFGKLYKICRQKLFHYFPQYNYIWVSMGREIPNNYNIFIQINKNDPKNYVTISAYSSVYLKTDSKNKKKIYQHCMKKFDNYGPVYVQLYQIYHSSDSQVRQNYKKYRISNSKYKAQFIKLYMYKKDFRLVKWMLYNWLYTQKFKIFLFPGVDLLRKMDEKMQYYRLFIYVAYQYFDQFKAKFFHKLASVIQQIKKCFRKGDHNLHFKVEKKLKQKIEFFCEMKKQELILISKGLGNSQPERKLANKAQFIEYLQANDLMF